MTFKASSIFIALVGQARLPEVDGIADIHSSYQLVIRFNADRADPEYTSTSLPQLEYYANSGMDP